MHMIFHVRRLQADCQRLFCYKLYNVCRLFQSIRLLYTHHLQLLGAIDELQAVSKTAPGVNVSQYHTPAELTDATNRHATTTNPNKVASTTPHRQAVVKERDTYTHPIAPHSSGATIVGPTTAGLALPSRSPPALRPAHCVAMVTPHVAMVTSHAGVGRAVQCVKSEVSNRTQHHGHAYFSDHRYVHMYTCIILPYYFRVHSYFPGCI